MQRFMNAVTTQSMKLNLHSTHLAFSGWEGIISRLLFQPSAQELLMFIDSPLLILSNLSKEILKVWTSFPFILVSEVLL